MSKRAMMEVMQIRNGLMVTPPKEAMQVLFERLANDPRNEVWTQWSVKSALEKLVKKASGMGIVAENRCFIRTKTVGSTWGHSSSGSDPSSHLHTAQPDMQNPTQHHAELVSQVLTIASRKTGSSVIANHTMVFSRSLPVDLEAWCMYWQNLAREWACFIA
ncbi:hypothetical protein J3A83DRAFT_4186152 [Scleroderma citrinum]